MPRLSIIVPIYKVADYLPQCLQSLRDQTAASDIEIICVDDGSPDISPAIAELFAKVDDRIVVVHKKNGGLSSARNAGIKAATGDYVAFVDGDDYVKDWFAECLIEQIHSSEPDVIVFGAHIWPKSASYPWLDFVLSPTSCFYEGFSQGLLEDPGTRPFAWRVAVRKELLTRTGFCFDEDLDFGEDQVFLLGLYPRAKRVAVISNKPYVYRAQRSGSLMEGRFFDRVLRAHDHVRMVEHTLRDWQAQGFLDKWGKELFFWSIGFCVPDILLLPNPGRTNVLVYLACVYKTFYPWHDLKAYCEERGRYAAFARAVLTDRSLASGLGRKLAYSRHTLGTEGIRPFIERPLWRLGHSRLAQAGNEALIRYAPQLSRDVARRKETLAANAKDAAWLVEILEGLNSELIAQGHAPLFEDPKKDTQNATNANPANSSLFKRDSHTPSSAT